MIVDDKFVFTHVTWKSDEEKNVTGDFPLHSVLHIILHIILLFYKNIKNHQNKSFFHFLEHFFL